MTSDSIDHFYTPFTHVVIKNFLDEKSLNKLKESYNALTFNLKKTDLFEFYQTTSLDITFLEANILEFLNKNQNAYKFIKQDVKEKNEIKITFDIFASYYTKGNYLLPHDDTIDNRRIAFCLYLCDFVSGELLLYNDTCDKEMKRIAVNENLLVMFGVEKAFHEVNYCETDGRMAITGWLNWNDKLEGKQVLNTCFVKYTRKIDTQKQLNGKVYNTLEECYEEKNESKVIKINLVNDIEVINNISYTLNTTYLGEEGPFYNRKLGKIIGSNLIFDLDNYVMIYKSSHKLRVGDYILLNDIVNKQVNDIVDIFCFQKIKVDNIPVVKYVNKCGEVEMEVNCLDNHIFCIERNNREIYIERIEEEIYMEHFIYKKVVKK